MGSVAKRAIRKASKAKGGYSVAIEFQEPTSFLGKFMRRHFNFLFLAWRSWLFQRRMEKGGE
jgi:hypothetical protein